MQFNQGRSDENVMYVVSHSHWDREWYMSFEAHRFRLIQLIDDLLEMLDGSDDFHSFHMDGYVLMIEDYLEVKPQNREKLLKYISEGRIKIGPYYVLQDAFLTSAESHVRNLLIGRKICNSYGGYEEIGYYPDTFGNVSQTPQILAGFGIDNAFFGRGLNASGHNNEILHEKGINDSEIIWKSPDGSAVIGIMFANWYNNGMELQTEPEIAKIRFDSMVSNARSFAKTPYLLAMNGCDHQPLQRDVLEALKLQNGKHGVRDYIHSSLADYVEAVRPYRERLREFEGEIQGQYTNGYNTLIGTASSRIHIKQKNDRVQRLLEKGAEPIAVMAKFAGDSFYENELLYAWKTLLQSHPHDSICCCSVDEVCREVEIRIDKAGQVAEEVIAHAGKAVAEAVDTEFLKENEKAVIVFRSAEKKGDALAKAIIDFPANDSLMHPLSLEVSDLKGEILPCSLKYLGEVFTYDLPRRTFRIPKRVNRYEISFLASEMPAVGYNTYVCRISEENHVSGSILADETSADNGLIKLEFNEDGSFNMTDLKSGRIYEKCNVFEDMGDRGNEYEFIPANDNEAAIITGGTSAKIELIERSSLRAVYRVAHEWRLPVGLDENEARTKETRAQKIESFITLNALKARVDVQTFIYNDVDNHRIRALFSTEIKTNQSIADGHFDLIEREITPWEGWENPLNPQRSCNFVTLCDDNHGFLVAHKGLHEYEIKDDKSRTMALTLFRGVDEMGDWGYFPTPEAQAHGVRTAEYSLIPYQSSEENMMTAISEANSFHDELPLGFVTEKHSGNMPSELELCSFNTDSLRFSALKKAEARKSVILRFYNMSDTIQLEKIRIDKRFKKAYLTRLDETRLEELPVSDSEIKLDIGGKKIMTVELEW